MVPWIMALFHVGPVRYGIEKPFENIGFNPIAVAIRLN
jgi:hypothetical protein